MDWEDNNIIFTDGENCVGCNKCITSCPVHFANTTYQINGERKVKIDNSKCILCGNCLEVCDHNARGYNDDTERFFSDLKKGKKISIIAAPSLIYNFENYKNLFGFLKSLGANIIYDVAFGASITTWAYLKAVKELKLTSVVSQTCPVVVNYVEKYKPELIQKLAPVQSPAVCTSVYIKKYLNINNKIAFLSPCIGKISEFNDKNTLGKIEYNVTYKKIREYLEKNKINLDTFEEKDFDGIDYGIGVVFSRPGGLGENIKYHMPDAWIKQTEGQNIIYKYLKNYSKRILQNKDLPLFIDVLNCPQGCNLGTGTCKDIEPDDIDYKMNIIKKEKIKNIDELSASNSIKSLFEKFDKELNLNDFIRKYEDKSEPVKVMEPADKDYEDIFADLHKKDEKSRNINCYACGFGNCKEMAKSLFNNINILESCIYYNRKELELEQQHLLDKNDEFQAILEDLKVINEDLRVLNEEKEQNEIRITSILNNIVDGVILINEEGTIEFCNPVIEHIFGYYPEEIIGQNIDKLGKNILNKENKPDNIRTMDLKEETVGCRKDSTEFPLEFGMSKITLDNRNMFVIILHDISERKEVENLKDEFVSTVSHELRTPLTSIYGALGLLASDKFKEANFNDIGKMISIAHSNSLRLIHTINDILDIQKIEAGKMEFNCQKLDLIPIIEQTIDANHMYAKQYHVKYKLQNKLSEVNVYADINRLIQVITNLLSNSAKFSPPDSEVTINVFRKDKNIRVEFTDKGSGIPKEFQSRIFKKFAQADASSSRRKEGTGLGLSICKAIVEKLDGEIGFITKSGEGTTFYFELPEITYK